MLERFVHLHLLLLVGHVQALLEAVVEVKVRLQLIIKPVIVLLLELLQNGGIGARDVLTQLGGVLVD